MRYDHFRRTVGTTSKPRTDPSSRANADTFGNQDDCAPFVKYVAFFGANFPALKSGKVLGLTVSSILLVLYLLITFYEEKAHLIRIRRPHAKRQHDPEATLTGQSPQPDGASLPLPAINIIPPSRTGTGDGITMPVPMPAPPESLALNRSSHSSDSRSGSPSSRSDTSSWQSMRRRGERRPKRPGTLATVDPMFISLSIMHFAVFVYFVLVTELLLHRNPAADNSNAQWGFGQVSSLFLNLVRCTR